jgi:hypothetical protein
MEVKIENVLKNNQNFLKNSLNITVEDFLITMRKIGPSTAFKKINKSYSWQPSNPTEGWCGQMTRFLKDYDLIPNGYWACRNDDKYHYYLVDANNEVIDLTIYQMIDYTKVTGNDVINYDCNKARFNPVKDESTKDAMRLKEKFLILKTESVGQ